MPGTGRVPPSGSSWGPGLLDAVVPLGEDLAGARMDDSRRVPLVSTPAGVGCAGKRPQFLLGRLRRSAALSRDFITRGRF